LKVAKWIPKESKAKKNFLPMQPGDVQATSADTSELNAWVGFSPNTEVKTGVAKFVQ
jgi:UDP-glucuronate 4-epimerase